MEQTSLEIQQKCSISSLISNSVVSSEIKKSSRDRVASELFAVKSMLLKISESLQSSSRIDSKKIHYDLAQIVVRFESFNACNLKPTAEERKLYSEVGCLTREILLLLNERRQIQDKMDRFTKKVGQTWKEKSDNYRFNIVTQKMMLESKPGEFSNKRHRLEREKVQILEKWYNEHSDRPYLNETTLNFLEDTTGLTKIQIRNWISNKRRKEKCIIISEELSELLK